MLDVEFPNRSNKNQHEQLPAAALVGLCKKAVHFGLYRCRAKEARFGVNITCTKSGLHISNKAILHHSHCFQVSRSTSISW